MSNIFLPSIVRNEEISKIEQNTSDKSAKQPYDYFSTKIPKSQLDFILKKTKDDRFLFFIKYGTLRRYEGDFDLIYIEIPQIPKKLVVYRLPNIRAKSKEKLYLGKRDLPHIPLFEGEEHLMYLTLEMNNINKLDQLISLSNLIYLNLYYNKIEEIENLQCTPKLKVLLLGKNQIEKIKGLFFLVDLEILDLHSNKIKIIENISQLKKLRIINLANNQISSLNELLSNKNLEEINIRKNQITSIPNLTNGFEKLKKLNISKNLLAKKDCLVEFAKLRSLKELILEDNPVLSTSEGSSLLKKLPIVLPPNSVNNKNTSIATITNNISINTSNTLGSPLSANRVNGLYKLFSKPSGTNINNYASQNVNTAFNSSINTNIDMNSNLTKSFAKRTSCNSTSNSKIDSISSITSNSKIDSISSITSNSEIKKVSLIFSGKEVPQNKLLSDNPLYFSLDSPSKISIKTNEESSYKNGDTAESEFSVNNGSHTRKPSVVVNDTSQSEKIINNIKSKWQDDYKKIVKLGYNGYINKRFKDITVIDGHCEIKQKNKVILYGNALKVLHNEDIQNATENMRFNYFQFDFIMCRKNDQYFKNFKNLRKISFSHNNLHSFYQIIKLESLPNLEKVKIENNEVSNSILLKYFLIYRLQNLKKYNKSFINDDDIQITKLCFERFDKCISINEQIRDEIDKREQEQKDVKIEENKKENTSKEKDNNKDKSIKRKESKDLSSNKIVIDSKKAIEDKKYLYFKFVKNNLLLSLNEILDELYRNDDS